MQLDKKHKYVLVMRHLDFLWGVKGRLRLIKIVLNIIGRECLPILTSAPEKEAEVKTAEPVLELLEKEIRRPPKVELPELQIDDSLSDDSGAPPHDDLVRKFATRGNPEFLITHFKRLETVLESMRSAFGMKLETTGESMRLTNKAYLVDLTDDKVYVIKEKD